MRNLLDPRWIFLINTAPVALLITIFYGHYSVINTLLNPDQLYHWKLFGIWLIVLSVLHTVLAGVMIMLRKRLNLWYALVTLMAYLSFLYVYIGHGESMIGWNIPRWMVPQHAFLQVGAFLMPTLVYALLIMVNRLTKNAEGRNPYINFLISLAVPATWYLFFNVIMPTWRWIDNGKYAEHVFAVIGVASVVLFLFFLIRSVYILISKKGEAWSRYQLVWKVIIAIIFPMLGLALSNGDITVGDSRVVVNVIGNFSSPWFYILAVANGIFICLPALQDKTYRTVLFIARSITLAYTFYFFMVFLPFLPLSVLAIILIGLGFLMLTPLVLMVVHVNELAKDFRFLLTHYSRNTIWTLCVVAALVMPGYITFDYLQDKHTLHQALDYLYAPDLTDDSKINEKALAHTLHVVESHKARRFRSGEHIHLPYLNTYYNWLVLDNMTLSDHKINLLQQVFFDAEPKEGRRNDLVNEDVGITGITTKSTYDPVQDAWVSWVNLEITNENMDRIQSEYATSFQLPAGCYISDYYLDVEGRRENGILAEKKSALWIFNQIRRVRRDPGLLYYLGGNKVAFRIFPFAKGEVRTTGIEFLHKEPVSFQLDDRKIQLGDSAGLTTKEEEVAVNDKVVYIPALVKQKLDTVQRTPYYHFIIDVSASAGDMRGQYNTLVQALLDKQQIPADNAKVTFANAYTNTFEMDNDWQDRLEQTDLKQGFYLERALKEILIDAHENPTDRYPVIVVATADHFYNAVIEDDLADLAMAFPESEYFYELNDTGLLVKHSLIHNPKTAVFDDEPIQLLQPVLAWPDANNVQAYLPVDSQASVVVTGFDVPVDYSLIAKKQWESAMLMEAMWQDHALHPPKGEEEWLDLVRNSFKSGVMTPVTSYIVVENEAQKQMLYKKQEQVLSGKKALDLGEEPRRMSEPGLWILLLLAGGSWWIWLRRY